VNAVSDDKPDSSSIWNRDKINGSLTGTRAAAVGSIQQA
jgi:hypothetical protein